jgi:fructose-1,6-bisphosphatase II
MGVCDFAGGALMNGPCDLSPNLGLDLVRATEAAALAAARWTGLGRLEEAERAATTAMRAVLQGIAVDGVVCLGEEGRQGEAATFAPGQPLGASNGPAVDVLVEALEGRRLLAGGYPGALSAVAVAPRGAIWAPRGVRYMEKIVVNVDVAPALAPECLDAPAAWTLALVARAKGKQVRDLVVFVLDRTRHADLVAEIRAAGSHVMLRSGGDLAGALMACLRDGKVDLLMGSGGVPQGMLAACAVKATGGAMLVRLAAQTPEEAEKLKGCDPDDLRIRSLDELVAGRCAFFVATGITDSPLLNGVRYHGPRAESNSIILRAETGIRRTILTEHCISE